MRYGCAVAVDEKRIIEWMKLATSSEGISVCPESAACVGAAEMLAASNWISPDDQVVVFNCGAVQKYADLLPLDLPEIAKDAPIDWEALSCAASSTR